MSDSEASDTQGESVVVQKRRSGQRPKKRRFVGNKYVDSSGRRRDTSLEPEAGPSSSRSTPTSGITASTRKLSVVQPGNIDASWAGYRLVDRDLWFGAMEEHCRCTCGGSLELDEQNTGGLSSTFTISCQKCGKRETFNNSEKLGPKKSVADVNRRSVFAIRSLGLGHAGLQKFCAHMELPPPVRDNTFQSSLKQIHAAVQKEANKSMLKAAQEEGQESGGTDVGVSGDGTWQRRGHTSMNGVCTVIGLKTGKVIDVEILSKLCQGCAHFDGDKDSMDYEEWWEEHKQECQQNHTGSAGKMEADGMVNIFARSEETRGLRYIVYCGDQHSKTYKSILESNPYEVQVEKKECVGHIEKKMGRWLRNLKKNQKGVKLADGKGLFGRGRLTDTKIDQIQNYYGRAIRNNSGSVEDMTRAVWAIFYHMQATDEAHNHSFCPSGPNSWCKYQVAVSEGKEFTHKKPDIPPVCLEACRGVFEELTKPDLLKRCLGASTQNNNESLNQLIWKYAPKAEYCGKRVVEVATYLAVLDFNEGQRGKIGLFKELGMKAGGMFVQWAEKVDSVRMEMAEARSESHYKGERKAKKMLGKAKANALEEGLYYDPGSF